MLRASSCVAVLVLLNACGRPVDDRDGGSDPDEESKDPDRDNATLRRKALAEWFDEAHTSANGPFSIDFRQAMLGTAEQERERWSSLLPQPPGQIDLITGTTWSNLGPTKANNLINGVTLHVTDSGRARTIIADGTTIYLATAGGGVWKRTGTTWTPITETIGTLSCGSLAMDPANHNILYLGLGDPFDGTGIGLLKSTNAGTSWSSPVFLGASTIIPQVMVDPNDSTIILAATDAGLFRSTNSGATFNQVTIATGQAPAPYVWSIASTGVGSFVLSLEANHAAATGTTDGQVWTSTDHGASWTRATGMTNAGGVGRITVASAPSSPTTVYAMAALPNNFTTTDLADFYKSTNGGATWTALAVTNKRYTNQNTESSRVGTILGGQGWYNQLVIVSPTNANTVFWGGQLLLAKTTDGGTTYTEMSNWLAQFSLPYVHADFHAGTIDASGNLFVGTDGGIFESTDGGTTFTDTLNQNVITHLLYSVGSSPNSTSVVLGGMQDDGTRLRVGTSTVFDEVIGGDGFGTNVNRSNAAQMLGSIYYLQIEKSTNGGTSWANATTGIAEVNDANNAPFITRLIPWEGSATGNEMFTFSNFKVYKSTNYAGSWAATSAAPIASGAIRNVGVATSNINIIGVVASGGRVLLSSNGGASWTTVAANASPDPMALPNSNLSLSWIHFDVSDPNTVYVASVAADATKNHLWKSTNFGGTWSILDNNNGMPVGAPVNIIKSDPVPAPGPNGQVLYAGTHMGIYRTTNAGATWSRFGAGMPLVSVTDMYVSPDDSLVRAATYGRGFWELITPAANDFSISASPATVTAVQGNSGTTTVSTMVTSGTAETIALSASGLPAGATAAFAPTSVTAGGSSTLTLTAGAATTPGTYTVTITGTAPSATHTTTVSFVVTAKPDFSISASPATVTVQQGNAGTTAVSTTVTAGTPETVALSASGLPAGATAAFAPTSVTAGGSSTLTLTAGAATTPGTYTVTISGTAPSATHTTTVSFVVTAKPNFSISASPATVTVVQGGSGTTTVSTTVTAGAPETIALSASGLPAGATATFAPTSVTTGGSSTLTLTAGAATTPGTYTVTITGTSPSATHTTTVSFVVTVKPDFSISASPATVTVQQGSSGTTTVSTTATAGTPETITLSASGLPAGATATFAPTSVTAGGSSTLTLTAGAATTPGTYTVTITGTAPSATHSTTVSFVVTAKPNFSISASPATVTVVQGSSGTTTVSTTVTAGAPETIALSASGLPAGATATFAPTSVTAGGSSTLTLTAGAATPPGTYTVTITGTAPSATHTTTVSFVVTAKPNFSISASPATVTVVQGNAGTTTVSTMVTAGTPETIALSASGLPAGATATFAPTSVTAGGSSTLTLTAGAATPPGTYTVTITGTAPSATHTTTVSFVVLARPDFSISVSPATVTVVQGDSGMTTVSTVSTAGTPETIALSASGLPAGATATFVPTSVTAGGSSMLTLAAGATTTPGTYTVTITGTAPSATHATTVSFVVLAKPDFSISASPDTVTVVQGDSGTTTVSTVSTAGTPETIALSASGLPAGATATFVPTSVTAGGASTLTLAPDLTTTPGTYTVTITGTASSATHSTTVSFVVLAKPDFAIIATPPTVSVVQGNSGTTMVSTMSTAGTPETIALSADGLPTGVTATFAPTGVNAGDSSVLTLATDVTTAPGSYTVTITGTAASATHTTTVTLEVAAIPDFTITAMPASVTIVQGDSGATTVSTTATAGTPEMVALSASDVPAGVTATFAPTGITAGDSSTLSLAVDATTPEGTYTFTVTGTATSATHTASVTLEVTAKSHGDHGGCGCAADGKPNAANGALFAIVLGFVVRRRRRRG